MVQIVNLRNARKAKARAEARAKADENALKFGRTKGERQLEQARAEKTARDLDAHRIDRTDKPRQDGSTTRNTSQ